MDPGLIVEKKQKKKIKMREIRPGSYIRKHMSKMDFTPFTSFNKNNGFPK